MRDLNAKTGGGGGGGSVRVRPIQPGREGWSLRSADSTSGKAHFRSIEKVDGCCPDQLAFN